MRSNERKWEARESDRQKGRGKVRKRGGKMKISYLLSNGKMVVDNEKISYLLSNGKMVVDNEKISYLLSNGKNGCRQWKDFLSTK